MYSQSFHRLSLFLLSTDEAKIPADRAIAVNNEYHDRMNMIRRVMRDNLSNRAQGKD